jgi:hypothetical protein
LLQELFNAGRLPLFVEASSPKENTDGLGNCHEATLALMADLIVDGYAEGWHRATGQTHGYGGIGVMRDSWLEIDGRALDCANSKLVFADRWWRRRIQSARNIRLRDAQVIQQWIRRRTA